MTLRNCVRCGKLFSQHKISDQLCHSCFISEEQQYRLCRDYLKDHPSATLQEVCDNTGISYKQLTSWIREGRIQT